MNALTAPDLYRSEAFAEDLVGLLPKPEPVPAPAPAPFTRRPVQALQLGLPVVLAVVGAVMTVLVPLA